MEIAFSLVVILVGFLLLTLGYLIRFHQIVEIIAGYDPNKVKDKDSLVKWVGSNFLFMGLMCLFLGGLGLIIHGANIILIWSFIVMILTISIRTAIGCKKYEK